MAEKFENPKGHLIIKMSNEEAKQKCQFGFEEFLVCDNCNEELNKFEDVYYFASLNMCFCSECSRQIRNRTRYKDIHSIAYEVRNYNFYASKLGLELIKSN